MTENKAESERHIRGATIAWSRGEAFDFENPETTRMTIEDYAYALAYTVRWRGQTWVDGARAFYGVAQHCYIGALDLLEQGADRDHALAFLMHESDEVPLPDMPGPAKPLFPGYREVAKRCGAAIDARFRVPGAVDGDLLKRQDIRMMVTEKRDLLQGHDGALFSIDGKVMADSRYLPLGERIIPERHPDMAAAIFLQTYDRLGGYRP